MIYFDNAATSFPKPKSVIREVDRCLYKYCGNPGRSSHQLAIAAADKIFEVRELVADFLDYDKCENIVFTPNATYALNLVIKGLVTHKCHCIVSDLEHNSVLRPLYKSLTKFGGELSVFDSDLPITEAIVPLIKSDTEIIITTLCSNVTGKIVDLSQISSIAKSHNLKLVIDASQYLGHLPISLDGLYYTAFCSAGHKGLFGIQGSSFALINNSALFDTLTEGGSGIDSFAKDMPLLLPERYEAGTLPTPAIASLGAGIDFINRIGVSEISNQLYILTEELKNSISNIKSVTLYGAENGIAAFNIADLPSSYVSNMLDKKGIATRSGFHCAPLIHNKLRTETRGAVRVSFSYFNTCKEIYELCRIIREI